MSRAKRIIETALIPQVIIREENSIAALEVMSRFAVDPRWLVYLPPTMSPAETSRRPDLLEHPDQVFEAFRKEGVEKVVCEEKHMGSRAVVIVCQGDEVAARRFGLTLPEVLLKATVLRRKATSGRVLRVALSTPAPVDASSMISRWRRLLSPGCAML